MRQGEYPKLTITLKGRIGVMLCAHYCQDDGSCQCGWKPTGKEYPENAHPFHLAEIIHQELAPELNELLARQMGKIFTARPRRSATSKRAEQQP